PPVAPPTGGAGTSASSASVVAAFRARAQGPKHPDFDGNRAYQLLKQQVAFGPRVPGTKGHVACRDFLVKTLKECSSDVTLQEFTQTYDGKTLPMAKIIARWRP